MDPQGQPKFVQITTTVAPMSPTLLYALDSAGSVWLFNFAKKKWGRLSNDRRSRPPEREKGRAPRRGPGLPFDAGFSSGLPNVRGLEPLRALGHFELDLVALGQALEALGLNGVEMHEDVLATLLGDEAVTLRIVEPLTVPCAIEPTSLF